MRRRRREQLKLYLHVGLAKTGTTYLQGLLADNRAPLQDAGVLYPFIGPGGMFHAAVEMLDAHERWGLDRRTIDGSWRQMAIKAEKFSGSTLISHEFLAGAAPDKAASFLQLTPRHEVHVVVTVRDLSRQVPAFWQERVKNGATYSFAELAQEMTRGPDAPGADFWNGQSLRHVMNRWDQLVPPERVHIVVCPPPGAAPHELWNRFADAIRIPPEVLNTERELANESLGCTQVHLLRDLNAQLSEQMSRPDYIHVVKRRFTQQVLAATEPVRKPLAPEQIRPYLQEVTHEWFDLITKRGYQVHGDIDDLEPAQFAPEDEHPDSVDASELEELFQGVLAALLVDLARTREN